MDLDNYVTLCPSFIVEYDVEKRSHAIKIYQISRRRRVPLLGGTTSPLSEVPLTPSKYCLIVVHETSEVGLKCSELLKIF